MLGEMIVDFIVQGKFNWFPCGAWEPELFFIVMESYRYFIFAQGLVEHDQSLLCVPESA